MVGTRCAPASSPPGSGGWGIERATQVGSAVATAAVEVVGTQEYTLPREQFLGRFAEAFGGDAADEVAPFLPG